MRARIHYAYLDVGGVAPNVVQAKAIVRQIIRAGDLMTLRNLVERVRNIADGAALMTGTTVETRVYSGVSNLVGNRPLEEAMQREFDKLGPVCRIHAALLLLMVGCQPNWTRPNKPAFQP